MSPKSTSQTDEQVAAQAAEDQKAAAAQAKAEAKAAADQAKAEAKTKKEQEKIVAEAAKSDLQLDSITGTGADGAVILKDVREAAKAKRAQERANRPKKAPMTLSQRRAMVKLHEDGPQVARTGFNELPFDYLVSVGLVEKTEVTVSEPFTVKEEQDQPISEADRKEGGPTSKKVKVDVTKERDVVKPQYSLTEAGQARAPEINRKWKTWKPDTASTPASTNGDSASTPAPDPEPVA